MHKLLILSRHARDYHRLIDAAALPDLAVTSATDPADATARAGDSDLALGEPSLLRRVLPALTSLRWVQATWAGVEPLLDPALRRDYILTNARGVFGGLMSEYVFAYLLAHERRILEKRASQAEGRWDPTHPGTLRGKQIGLLGVGTIGAALAMTAKHFGMRVKGYTRVSEDSPDVDAYFHSPMARVRTAFAADLDYLVSVMPATAESRHIVDAALLRELPAHAVFVNPGRGGIVDEPALAAALAGGRLAGAVLDVFQEEPLPRDHVFWRTPNLLITAHTAALSVPEDIAPVFIENYRRLLRAEPLKYRVDFDLGY
jgi:phosphoglycerate dehydrogenase-like enzyme